MNFCGWNNVEDLLRACGYNNTSSNSSNNTNNNNSSSSNNSNDDNYTCSDIPNGFQGIPPELVAIIGEILGNIIAGNLPFNVQNIIGNWLELVGQVILVFNAQQQYFQSGPGRYFDQKNYNINNPFCSTSSSTNNETSSGSPDRFSSSNNSSTDSNSKNNNGNSARIEELEKQVQELTKELNEIKMLLKQK